MRHAVAGQETLSETEVARVVTLAPELPARDRAALRWADALLLHPDDIDAELRAEVASAFDPAELLELSVAIMFFASSGKQRMLFGLLPPVENGAHA